MVTLATMAAIAHTGCTRPVAAAGPDAVEGERQPQVLLGLRIRAAADLVGVHHRAEPVAHDDDVGGLDGDVGAGADGDADVGLHQRRGVVYAVADHDHAVALLLKIPHDVRLVLGQHLGPILGDAHLLGHRPRGASVISGEHDRIETRCLEALDRLPGVVLDPVGEGDESRRLAVNP